jgi:phosphoribosylamine--glycine ligase
VKILVVGGGGREHALAWRLARSAGVREVLVAPGNAGTAREPGCRNVEGGSPEALAALAAREGVAFTVVGPEAALAAGVVDTFRAHGLRIFGPTRAAARLESSKAFAKAFMRRHGIPTAAHDVFEDRAAAHAHVDAAPVPVVVKADGLAAGRGVVVAATREEAHAAIDAMLQGPGDRVVVEAFLEGEEASFFVVCDGAGALPLATAQDHKRIFDGDRGPNTGGMGAYSPAPVVTPAVHARVLREIVEPTIAGMAAEGTPFAGFLYVGLMVDATGAPRVVEYNVRLGDPEAQVLMQRFAGDLAALLGAACEPVPRLDAAEARWDPRPALGVVLAAANYPAEPRAGDAIEGLPDPAAERGDAKVFHAGTRIDGGRTVTAGGRVLLVSALGTDVAAARDAAYAAVAPIRFDGMQFRRDIGHRALARASGSPA